VSCEPMNEAELREEVERLHALLEGKTQYVDCVCPGCPRKVPEAWAAGMCSPCATEDCEHPEGARATAAELDVARAERDEALSQAGHADNARTMAIAHADRLESERDQARADLAQAVEDRERLRAAVEADRVRLALERGVSAAYKIERDRLRAVLADVDGAVADYFRHVLGGEAPTPEEGEMAVISMRKLLAALRARAGLEPTPTPDPRPLRELVHATEANADGVFFVDLICGHRIATRQQQGEYPCLYCGSGERRRPAP
jgi:hypothetical protein